MIAPAYARHEAQRLQALRALLILDTPPEQRFERIVDFAVSEFDVPMAAISLVDADRQWFKAVRGLSVCETSRDLSFCGHAILRPDDLIPEIGQVQFEQQTVDQFVIDNEYANSGHALRRKP